jgi:hypothetical protein
MPLPCNIEPNDILKDGILGLMFWAGSVALDQLCCDGFKKQSHDRVNDLISVKSRFNWLVTAEPMTRQKRKLAMIGRQSQPLRNQI